MERRPGFKIGQELAQRRWPEKPSSHPARDANHPWLHVGESQEIPMSQPQPPETPSQIAGPSSGEGTSAYHALNTHRSQEKEVIDENPQITSKNIEDNAALLLSALSTSTDSDSKAAHTLITKIIARNSIIRKRGIDEWGNLPLGDAKRQRIVATYESKVLKSAPIDPTSPNIPQRRRSASVEKGPVASSSQQPIEGRLSSRHDEPPPDDSDQQEPASTRAPLTRPQQPLTNINPRIDHALRNLDPMRLPQISEEDYRRLHPDIESNNPMIQFLQGSDLVKAYRTGNPPDDDAYKAAYRGFHNIIDSGRIISKSGKQDERHIVRAIADELQRLKDELQRLKLASSHSQEQGPTTQPDASSSHQDESPTTKKQQQQVIDHLAGDGSDLTDLSDEEDKKGKGRETTPDSQGDHEHPEPIETVRYTEKQFEQHILTFDKELKDGTLTRNTSIAKLWKKDMLTEDELTIIRKKALYLRDNKRIAFDNHTKICNVAKNTNPASKAKNTEKTVKYYSDPVHREARKAHRRAIHKAKRAVASEYEQVLSFEENEPGPSSHPS